MEIEILVGTMTGTANLVAQEIELTYGEDDVTINIHQMDDFNAGDFRGG